MKPRNIWESFNSAIEGIIYVAKTQRHMRIHLGIAIIVLFLSLFLRLDRMEMILLFFTVILVLVAEMINTAVECIVNLITDSYHPVARVAKDIAAGAVFFASINAIVIGYLIFGRKYFGANLLPVIIKIKQAPEYVLFMSLVIVFLFVIIGKAYFGRGRPLWGGMPSGHSAVSFAVATAVAFITQNTILTILIFVMAFLVAHSRVRTGIHTWWEVIGGAAIGIWVTLFIFRIIHPL